MKTKKKKYEIDVMLENKVVMTISRVLTARACGNFNPIYCRFNSAEYLVNSREGDLSDPFRREESHLNSLFINL